MCAVRYNYLRWKDRQLRAAANRAREAWQRIDRQLVATRLSIYPPTEEKRPMQQDTTLYQRLREEAGLKAVVEGFYTRVLVDPLLAPYFQHLGEESRKQLQWHMRAFLVAATGGPQRYNGRDIRTAHAHLHITDQAFDRVAERLVETLTSFGVAREDREAIVDAVAPLRDQIVTASAAPPPAELPAADVWSRGASNP